MKKNNVLLGNTAMAAAKALRVAIQILSLPILGRILGPHAYGQLALVSPFIYFSILIAESGLSACIVRVDRISKQLLGTIFCFSAGFSLLIIMIFLAAAYPLGLLLGEPAFPALLMGMSSILLLSAFNVVPAGLLLREKQYQWMALSDFVSAIGGVIAVTVGIMLDWGTWSLVAQEITFWVLKVIVVTIGTNYSPRLIFKIDVIKANLKFGANLTGTSLLTFFVKNIDNILIGAFIGTQALGYYALAFQAVGLPEMILAGSVYYTLFSGTSEAVRAGKPLSTQFLKALRGIFLLSAPIMVGLAVTARLSIPLLLGDKWSPMIDLVLFLAPYGLAQTSKAATSGVLIGMGRSDIMLRLTLIATATTIIAILAGVHFGTTAVALGVSLAAILNAFLALRVVVRECSTSSLRLLEALAGPLVASLLMGAAVVGLQAILPQDLAPLLALIASIALGAFTYVFVLFVFFRDKLMEDIEEIKAALRSRSRRRK